MTIPNLNTSDTFKTWFDRTNSVISEINGITIHDLKAGDGISLGSISNVFTVSHGNLVATGVTFTGPIKFTNSVAFSTSPTIDATVVSVSPKTAGITIGNVVRMSGAGLTLAKADSAQNAEVLGVVVSETSAANVVAVAGSINNTNFSKTISNILGVSGGTLGVGYAYFLDPVVAGGITTVEPVTYGQVSKPVILGISAGLGSIIPYRGIQIEGISAGITAELDNKVIIQLDTSAINSGLYFNSESGNPVQIGDPVVLFTETAQNENLMVDGARYLGAFKTLGTVNNGTFATCAIIDGSSAIEMSYLLFSPEFLGFVSKIISHTGNVWILEITLPGGNFEALISELDSNFYVDVNKSGTLLLTPNPDPEIVTPILTVGNYDPFNTQILAVGDVISVDANKVKIILNPFSADYQRSIELQKTINVSTIRISNLTAEVPYKVDSYNLLPNSTFVINQRNITSLTKDDLKPHFTPFVDRWFFVKGTEAFTGLTFNARLMGTTFDSGPLVKQPGFIRNDKYWIDVSFAHTGTTFYYDGVTQASRDNTMFNPKNAIRLENIQNIGRSIFDWGSSSSRSGFANRNRFSFGFRAKLSSGTGQITAIANWYPEPSIHENLRNEQDWYYKLGFNVSKYTTIQGFTLTDEWQDCIVRGWAPNFNGWKALAYNWENQLWFGIGFKFESLSGVTVSINSPTLIYGDGLTLTNVHPMMRYYSPREEYERCKPYYYRTYDWNQLTRSSENKGNEHTLQLGNLITQKLYTVKYPVQMFRKHTTKNPITATLYSTNGITGEAFNVNTGGNTNTLVSGALTVNLPWDSTTARTVGAAGQNIVVVPGSVNENSMVVEIKNGATHLDALKFHYVIDADYDPQENII